MNLNVFEEGMYDKVPFAFNDGKVINLYHVSISIRSTPSFACKKGLKIFK